MKAKYDQIGTNYNSTRRADPYLTERLHYLLQPQPNGVFLDIGCGTGNYTIALNERGISFIGIDPSQKMLDVARSKNDTIDWRLGFAERTSLETGSINGVLGSLTIHHWTNLEAGFTELYRVLKPGGRIVFFTATPEQMRGYWLCHYFPIMLEDSMQQMPDWELVENALLKAGFQLGATEPYFIKPDLQDLFLYSGKHNSSLYFDPNIRNGISSFSALTNQREVDAGLAQLKSDIDNGQLPAIKKAYENDKGDYLFVVGVKV